MSFRKRARKCDSYRKASCAECSAGVNCSTAKKFRLQKTCSTARLASGFYCSHEARSQYMPFRLNHITDFPKATFFCYNSFPYFLEGFCEPGSLFTDRWAHWWFLGSTAHQCVFGSCFFVMSTDSQSRSPFKKDVTVKDLYYRTKIDTRRTLEICRDGRR